MDWLTIIISILGSGVIAAFFGAFFAFLFFIVGQLWIESNKERKELINNLFSIRKFVTYQIYSIKINQKVINEINLISNPIQIFLNRFEFFSVEDNIYTKLYKYKVVESIIMFLVELKVVNNMIETLNNNIKELSDFSRIAMIERKEDDLRSTIENNHNDLKEKIKKLSEIIISINNKIDPLIAEIKFTLDYEKSYFWIKCFMWLRQKINSNYRNSCIQKIISK